jgi:hypothetical protein
MRLLLGLIFLALCETSFAQQMVVSYPVIIVAQKRIVENETHYATIKYGYWVREVSILPWRERWRYFSNNR